MNIKLLRSKRLSDIMSNKDNNIYEFRIDATFPPQKRTVHIAIIEYSPIVAPANILEEKTYFLEFPRLVFRLDHGTTFKLLAIDEENDLIPLILPNINLQYDGSTICLGPNNLTLDTFELRKEFSKTPNCAIAKKIIMPLIDYFWNSTFTTYTTMMNVSRLDQVVQIFETSKRSICPETYKGNPDYWILVEEAND